MSEVTWILDPATGSLVVEGMTAEEASALAGDLLPPGRDLNCARPLHITVPATSSPDIVATLNGASATLRIAHIYHGSLVDGLGRRSVVQFQGCPIRCPGCYVPETHNPTGGVLMTVADVVTSLLDPLGKPRDGVTVLGGEPFFQPVGLLSLLHILKTHGMHILVYSGYTLEALLRRYEPEIREALCLTDVLIDGAFVATLSDGVGEWRGSRNQRVILNPSAAFDSRRRLVYGPDR